MLAITMVAGAAVFGFVNGQAGSSAQQYGGQVQNQISALGERFVFAYTYFPQVSAPYNQVNIAIYNSGQTALSIVSISITEVSTGKIAVFSQTVGSPCSGSIAPALPTLSSLIPPQDPPTVYALVLPNSGANCLTGFTAENQYHVFALAGQGYNAQEDVTK